MRVIAAVILAGCVVACSTPTPAPIRTNAPAITEEPLQPPATPIRQSFIGSWYVHGAQLEIYSETSGLMKARSYVSCDPANDGGECSEHYALSLQLSNDETRLTAVIREITFRDDEGTMPGPEEANAEVGDSFALVFERSYLIKRTTLKGMKGFRGGNSFWCSTEMTTAQLEDQGWRCGA